MGSTANVDDNQWHQAVLTGAGNHQELYLDGTLADSISSIGVDHLNMVDGYIGNGYANGSWHPGAITGQFPFTGTLDEAAFYRHPLSAAQVLAHYPARAGSNRLSTVVEPGPFTATTINYNHATGRVTSLVDRNGATWTLGAPSVQPAGRQVTLSSSAYPTNQITYTYDPANAGRLTRRHEASANKTDLDLQRQRIPDRVHRRERQHHHLRHRRPRQRHLDHDLPRRRATRPRTATPATPTTSSTRPIRSTRATTCRTGPPTPGPPARATTPTARPDARTRPARPPRSPTRSRPGRATNPTETFTYTTGTGGVPAGLLATVDRPQRRGDDQHLQLVRRPADHAPTRSGWSTTNTYDGLGRSRR